MRRHIAELAAAGYFASGLNEPGEVRGVTLAGYHPGVSCSALRPGLVEALEEAVAQHAVNVFIDSGAFSEVAVVDGALRVVAPMAESDWEARLALYERLARSCGQHAYLVAPDRVGDQQETLLRLQHWAPRLRALRLVHGDGWLGPHLIVPLQRGALSLADFASRCCEVLELSEDELVWGLPSKKAATSLRELSDFARSCAPDATFHLLGMGPSSPRFEAAVLTLLHHCPAAAVTCDAVRVTALVGRREGVRPLTAAQDALRVLHPQATSSFLKQQALTRVLGAESVALLVDNGWRDDELPVAAFTVPERSDGQRSLFEPPARGQHPS